jgi:hypothetical protein
MRMPHERKDGTRRGILRRRLLVDARFQVTWVAGVIGIATALLIVLGGLYLSSLSEQRRLVGVNRLCLGAGTGEVAAEDREFDAELVSRLEEEDTRSTLILALSAAALVVLLAALAVRLTFHVAGPAKAVSAMLHHMTEGDPEPIRHLRRGDQFGFLEADVRHLHERLGRQAQADGELLEEAAAMLDERPGAGRHLADRLRERAVALRKRFPPLRD